MSDVTRLPDVECREAQRSIHERLDGETLDPRIESRLAEHLSGCADCREFDRDMRSVQQGLRQLGARRFPTDALDEVWTRTSRPAASRHRSAFDWRLAAAALVTLGLLGFWLVGERAPVGPGDEELRRAAAEARVVLNLTSQALQRTRSIAVREVLATEVAETLRKAPITWPAHAPKRDGGRSGT